VPGRHDLRAERRGLSHNVREETRPEHLAAGAAVLLNAVLRLAG
jgi:acetylornithine deacetylase/succinyl-diaminopimelate desuccinylase-like protein